LKGNVWSFLSGRRKQRLHNDLFRLFFFSLCQFAFFILTQPPEFGAAEKIKTIINAFHSAQFNSGKFPN
jgi:hypothetical protein